MFDPTLPNGEEALLANKAASLRSQTRLLTEVLKTDVLSKRYRVEELEIVGATTTVVGAKMEGSFLSAKTTVGTRTVGMCPGEKTIAEILTTGLRKNQTIKKISTQHNNPTNQQPNKTINQQTDKPTKQQNNKPTNKKTNKPTNQQNNETIKQ